MGTPEFAVSSLDILLKNNFKIVGVVTSPDKPAGRGQRIKYSAIKQYALDNDLTILQPTNLKDENFINDLRGLNANLQIVVAFRMLPEIVWSMPEYGTVNLHASLLPQYRGAAPINHAIINGEVKTGVSTFFLQHEIDTGKIIFQTETKIGDSESASSLHDRLKDIGSELVLKTVNSIENADYNVVDQEVIIKSLKDLKTAPKLTKDFCKIDWSQNSAKVYDFIRGLAEYPSAWSFLKYKNNTEISVKIFSVEKTDIKSDEFIPGTIVSDDSSFINVACKDFFVSLKEFQLSGKNRVSFKDFINGYKFEKNDKFI